MNDAVERLACDLFDAGVPAREISNLTSLYERALSEASPAAWERFYRATFAALHARAREPRAYDGRSRAAAESLLRILEDDFGRDLFGDDAVDRVREGLGRDLRIGA